MTKLSVKTAIVVVLSLGATAVSVYRIRELRKEDGPVAEGVSFYEELRKSNPTYAELMAAIRDRDVEATEAVLKKDPSVVNFDRVEGLPPPLFMAAMTNQADMVDVLVDHGANLEAKGRWGGTALHWAAWRGSADAVGALLGRGANANALSDNDLSTPLFWAARGSMVMRPGMMGFRYGGQHAEVVELLMKAGAKGDVKNRDGFWAVQVGTPELAEVLEKGGATRREAATQPTFGTAEEPYHGGRGFGRHGMEGRGPGTRRDPS